MFYGFKSSFYLLHKNCCRKGSLSVSIGISTAIKEHWTNNQATQNWIIINACMTIRSKSTLRWGYGEVTAKQWQLVQNKYSDLCKRIYLRICDREELIYTIHRLLDEYFERNRECISYYRDTFRAEGLSEVLFMPKL
jgi:hypothetical protein